MDTSQMYYTKRKKLGLKKQIPFECSRKVKLLGLQTDALLSEAGARRNCR